MKNLFTVILSVLFISVQPIQAMQSSTSNSNALIVAGTVIGAGCVAIGGQRLSSVILDRAGRKYDDIETKLNSRVVDYNGMYSIDQAKKQLLIKSALSGGVEFGSFVASFLILKAANSGIDRRSILSGMAITAGGAFLQASKEKLKSDKTVSHSSNNMFAAGMFLTVSGLIGIASSSLPRFVLDFLR